jgi:hypothetical protein
MGAIVDQVMFFVDSIKVLVFLNGVKDGSVFIHVIYNHAYL